MYFIRCLRSVDFMDFVGDCTLIGQNVEYDCYFSQEVRHRKLQAMIAANRMSFFHINELFQVIDKNYTFLSIGILTIPLFISFSPVFLNPKD